MRLLRAILQQVKYWDVPTRLAFYTALGLMVPVALAASYGPESARTPAIVGFIGLVFAVQSIVLWGNRHMVTAYTRAQRAYRDGRMEETIDILEAWWREADDGSGRFGTLRDVDALVLLGNTCRNLALLDRSREVLAEAIRHQPEYYFSLYGFARTLLVSGNFEQSVPYFRRAIEKRNSPPIALDLATASYFTGQPADAVKLLKTGYEWQNAYQTLWAGWLLKQCGDETDTLSDGRESTVQTQASVDAVRQDGIAFWQAEVGRFGDTNYGRLVASELSAMMRDNRLHILSDNDSAFEEESNELLNL